MHLISLFMVKKVLHMFARLDKKLLLLGSFLNSIARLLRHNSSFKLLKMWQSWNDLVRLRLNGRLQQAGDSVGSPSQVRARESFLEFVLQSSRHVFLHPLEAIGVAVSGIDEVELPGLLLIIV